jgi:dihydrofolate reductase
MIAAVAENGVIGRDNDLPWRLPGDLAYFKRLTVGHTLVIGRRTHESIGRALPDRRTIVVSSGPVEGMETAPSVPEAVERSETRTFLAGGRGIYEAGMALADVLYLTRVHAEVDGDVVFPRLDTDLFRLVRIERVEPSDRDDFPFSHETYVRIAPGSARFD